MSTRYRAFGLDLAVDFPLAGLPEVPASGTADLTLALGSMDEVESLFSGPMDTPEVWRTDLDDGEYRVERGSGGDLAFWLADSARYHLTSEADVLHCAAADLDDMRWQRVLLDSVLATTSMCHGFEALHASAVELSGTAVAFVAATGRGKTSMAAELVRRGHDFFCDDVLVMRSGAGAVMAFPGPPVMNLPKGGPAPAEVGEVLATFENELWVAVRDFSTDPLPLGAIILLDAGTKPGPQLERHDTPHPVPLFANALRSGSSRDRLARRFELIADVAERVPTCSLRTGPGTELRELGDAVEEALAGVIAQ